MRNYIVSLCFIWRARPCSFKYIETNLKVEGELWNPSLKSFSNVMRRLKREKTRSRSKVTLQPIWYGIRYAFTPLWFRQLYLSVTSVWFSMSPRSWDSARSTFHDRLSISASNCQGSQEFNQLPIYIIALMLSIHESWPYGCYQHNVVRNKQE